MYVVVCVGVGAAFGCILHECACAVCLCASTAGGLEVKAVSPLS